MSALTEELPKAVVLEWRKFMGTPAGQAGIDWLRHNRRIADGKTDMEIVRAATEWKGYMAALEDVQDVLTALPKKPAEIDEPGLETTNTRE